MAGALPPAGEQCGGTGGGGARRGGTHGSGGTLFAPVACVVIPDPAWLRTPRTIYLTPRRRSPARHQSPVRRARRSSLASSRMARTGRRSPGSRSARIRRPQPVRHRRRFSLAETSDNDVLPTQAPTVTSVTTSAAMGSACLASRVQFQRRRRCQSLPRSRCWVSASPDLAWFVGARSDDVTASQQPKPCLATATQDDNRALTEPDGEAHHGPWIAGHQQHRLVPAMQRSLRVNHREPPQALPKPLLHATVPPLRHAARARVPGRHQRRAARTQAPEQCLRRPTPDADVAPRGLVTCQPIGPRQTRRERLRLRCAPRRTRHRGARAPTSARRSRSSP